MLYSLNSFIYACICPFKFHSFRYSLINSLCIHLLSAIFFATMHQSFIISSGRNKILLLSHCSQSTEESRYGKNPIISAEIGKDDFTTWIEPLSLDKKISRLRKERHSIQRKKKHTLTHTQTHNNRKQVCKCMKVCWGTAYSELERSLGWGYQKTSSNSKYWK